MGKLGNVDVTAFIPKLAPNRLVILNVPLKPPINITSVLQFVRRENVSKDTNGDDTATIGDTEILPKGIGFV